MTRLKRTTLYVLLTVMLATTLLPVVWLFLTSLKTMDELTMYGPLGWPHRWNWTNIPDAWERGRFAIYYKNTAIIAVITVPLILVLSLLTSYVFVHFVFPGKKLLLLLLLVGLMAPLELLVIPLFYLVKDLGLMNTYWAIILPKAALYLPFGTFLLSGFMRGLPYGIIESARLDGAGELRILASVTAPVIRPALVTLALFATLSVWNSFLLPTVMIQRDDMRMVSTGLNYFQSQLYMDYPMLMSGALIIALPIIIVYFALNRRMIEGMTAGAMKG